MPDFEFTSPQGQKYVITGPEGSTQEEAFQNLQKTLSQSIQPPAATPKQGKVIPGLTSTPQEEGVDYTRGAPFSVRVGMAEASNEKEEEQFLRSQYGPGNYRKSKTGASWLVRSKEDQPFTPVFPQGVGERLETLGAYGVASGPEAIGGIGGRIVGGLAGGAIGGPAGVAVGQNVGSFAGGGAGYLMHEYMKYLRGFQDKSTGETLLGAAGTGLANLP